jgi:putative transposase
MNETKPSPLGNVITIDDERIKNHLDRVVRGSVEETLNALLDAEAERLCNAQRYERIEDAGIPEPATTNASYRLRLARSG